MQDATDRAFWADGTASLYNHGNFSCNTFLFSPNTELNNSGSIFSVDSALNQGTIWNTGSFEIYDFLNDEGASFENEGQIEISHEMNNQGYFLNSAAAELRIANDFSNCNIQNSYGLMENDGIVCISNDFGNCGNDTLSGSGDYFVLGASANLGVFAGTFNFHTPSGTMTIPGTIEPGVTVTTGTCTLTAESLEAEDNGPYPNPTAGILFIYKDGVQYSIHSMTGETVSTGITKYGIVDMRQLRSGVYFLKLEDGTNELIRIVKI